MRVSSSLVVLLFVAIVVEAQAPPSFREGVLAFEKKEWAAAEKAMREAVAGNPNESAGTVSIAGQWFETYVPHYFLARALAKQGKCEEALREFEESERQGITPAIPDFATHLKTRGGCKPQAKKEAPKRIAGEFEVPFADVPRPSGPRGANVPRPAGAAETPPPPLGQDGRAPAEERALRETRSRLSAAVSAYLRGNYEETIRLLTAAPFASRTAAAEAALFRAAARDALYRIGGAADETLRRDVERDLRTYRELHPNGKPDPRIFPPRFAAMARGR
ncbi:MAG TPA: hypothetical protein VNA69_12715 [Thermoanaerobaculia bacterium]|nr:hypothetical protein [Thermoanaerobaculia bacterium]